MAVLKNIQIRPIYCVRGSNSKGLKQNLPKIFHNKTRNMKIILFTLILDNYPKQGSFET